MQMVRIMVCVNTQLFWVYYPGTVGLGCNKKKAGIFSPFSLFKRGGGGETESSYFCDHYYRK